MDAESRGPRPEEPPSPRSRSWFDFIRRIVVGAPRSLADRSLFHRLSLIPVLAWVGLGADGLSSSAYGPEEAFRTLGEHTYLAVALAAVMASTVLIISSAYSRIIEWFPHGGGGYVVATNLLGERAGAVSGSALLVDYVLTITVSIAAAGDALFSFAPLEWHAWKVPVEILLISWLTLLNVRGVKESVLTLTPVFLVFVATHGVAIAVGLLTQVPALPETARSVSVGFHDGVAGLGMAGLLLLLVHAFSLGGGTYTGIEAVSNGLALMREPKVRTAKRTMLYMAVSLAFTATGILLCYLLWNIHPVEGKTMNAVLLGRLAEGFPFGAALAGVALFSEAALLVVAAQAGFLDGPRVLANMAVDSWVPRRFASLSDRLTTRNGIFLMGAAALGALLYTRGDVRHIVVMYSINVFLTFSLSMLGMGRKWISVRKFQRVWVRRTALFGIGFLLCATILAITIAEKFQDGGWITLAVTGVVVAICFAVRRHYLAVEAALKKLFRVDVLDLHGGAEPPPVTLDPTQATAAVLVGTFSGLGLHTVKGVAQHFPGRFQNLIFLSVGVIDSGEFKGEDAVAQLEARTRDTLAQYVGLGRNLGFSSDYRVAIGTDVVPEVEHLCSDLLREYPNTTFFAGKVIFHRKHWYQHILHNETALTVQRRLLEAGQTMVILPAVVH